MSFAAALCRTAPRLFPGYSSHSRTRIRNGLVVVVVGSTSCILIASSNTCSQHSKRRAFSTTHCCAANNSTRRPPPARFGMSVRHKHSDTLPLIPKDDKNDCPLCKKYSQGPCGELFQKWLACAEQYKSMMDSNTNEELHLSKCRHLALPMAECLDKHQEYYDSLDVYSDEYEERVLLQEWTKVVKQVEETHSSDTVLEFPPSLTPELQIRPSTNTGMAAFVYNHDDDDNSRTLTLAYVKDAGSGELLAAGSLEDLWEWQDKYGVLRLNIPPKTTAITAYALYDDVLYSTMKQVPPKEQQEKIDA